MDVRQYLLTLALNYMAEEGLLQGEVYVWNAPPRGGAREVRLGEEGWLGTLVLVQPLSHPCPAELLTWARDVADTVVAIDAREVFDAYNIGSYFPMGLGFYKLARGLGFGTLAFDPLWQYAVWVGSPGRPDMVSVRPYTDHDVQAVLDRLASRGIKAVPVSGAVMRGYAIWDVDVAVKTDDCDSVLSALRDLDIVVDAICSNFLILRTKYGVGRRRYKVRVATEYERKHFSTAFMLMS
ncbi:MAG: hypothetical protein ACPL3C_06925 [Pyrobaculum sp.]|uniref:hypothetical protein n=1 Tax=Pyrobaculum sp. TaxID=2004705 RepID=UPI003C9EA027